MIFQTCRRVLRVDFGFREVWFSCGVRRKMACFVCAWLPVVVQLLAYEFCATLFVDAPIVTDR
jgi:hypothetical protein